MEVGVGVKIVVGVNFVPVDGDDWPTFEADGILSVWNTHAHPQKQLTIQNETEAITVLRQIKAHRRLSLWIPADEGHIVHSFFGAMHMQQALEMAFDVYRLVSGGSPDGVIVFEEEFKVKVANVLPAWSDRYVVNLRLASGVSQEYFDDDA
jgi:hypothetical protein